MSEMNFADWYIVNAPKTLSEVYGQDVIVRYLKDKQKNRSFDKSTFFQGRYGSGKTVLAKILAKSIACKNINKDGEPCDDCSTCNAINNETWDRDVIYLNGEQMSAQEVDNILDKSMSTPAIRDAAKVFIIDETQGLSSAAIQKFLAATQSPRKGFYFIFTAMSKLAGKNPGALQSRCKNWKMKDPTNEEVYKYLGKICQLKELTKDTTIPREFFTEGLQFIVENSDASFRKAIQTLEQCYNGKIFTRTEMKDIFGIESYEDAALVLADISHGRLTKQLYEVIVGADYQEKFGLLIKIIGDAATYKAFGLKYVDESEQWRWKTPIEIANGPFFRELSDAFLSLADNAYIKRGEYQLIISNMLCKITQVSGVTTEPKASPVVRRRV